MTGLAKIIVRISSSQYDEMAIRTSNKSKFAREAIAEKLARDTAKEREPA
jgi:hypothetical protein